jgi:hypothetical protein
MEKESYELEVEPTNDGKSWVLKNERGLSVKGKVIIRSNF